MEKEENPSAEKAALGKTDANLKNALARRLTAIQSVCNSLTLSSDPEKSFAQLAADLEAIEVLAGKLPLFITGEYCYYRNALDLIDKSIAQKRSELTSFILPNSQKLSRVRERKQKFEEELFDLAEPGKESEFRHCYVKFWRRDKLDLSLLKHRARRYLARTFPRLSGSVSASEKFLKYCMIRKRQEILSEIERRLTYISTEERLINEAIKTLEDIRGETERLMLNTLTGSLNELSDLLNKNYDAIFEELTVILLHPDFTQFFEHNEASALFEMMNCLENIQMDIEMFQRSLEEIEMPERSPLARAPTFVCR